MRALTPFLLLAGIITVSCGGEALAAAPPPVAFTSADSLHWPPGTVVSRFENLEGIILLIVTLHGPAGRDTTGPLALDTGAGYLALDLGLAHVLGIADSAASQGEVGLTASPLPRLSLGDWAMDQLQPVLTVDADIVRRVSDRPVLGLLGQKPLNDRVVWIDYREQVAAFLPGAPSGDVERLATHGRAGTAEVLEESDLPDTAADQAAVGRSRGRLGLALTPRAVPVRFALVGDGKILVHGTLSDPRPPRFSRRLDLLIDTGATKCVLFDDVLSEEVAHAGAWPVLRGISAPTLIGPAEARIARVPAAKLEAVGDSLRLGGVEFGIVSGELGRVLSRVTRRTIHGLIGYSFLKHYRVAVDYPEQVLWLDPIPGYRDDRPFEYCQVGLQLERQQGAAMVVAVSADSPAARAGIAPGVELVAVGGAGAHTLDLTTLSRRLEGPPGTVVTLVIRKDLVERTFRLRRRRLL